MLRAAVTVEDPNGVTPTTRAALRWALFWWGGVGAVFTHRTHECPER